MGGGQLFFYCPSAICLHLKHRFSEKAAKFGWNLEVGLYIKTWGRCFRLAFDGMPHHELRRTIRRNCISGINLAIRHYLFVLWRSRSLRSPFPNTFSTYAFTITATKSQCRLWVWSITVNTVSSRLTTQIFQAWLVEEDSLYNRARMCQRRPELQGVQHKFCVLPKNESICSPRRFFRWFSPDNWISSLQLY